MRWLAPADTTGISLTSGPLTVEDGHVEAPDELAPGDRAGLLANDFMPAADTIQPAAESDKA